MKDFQVLVVDDNEDTADTMAAFLVYFGFTVHVAYSGQSAITDALADPPDAILCDIGLPGLDGYEVVRRLSEELPRRPVLVALTGRPECEVIRQGGLAGFDHYFLKPAELVEVGGLLSDYAIDRSRASSQRT